MKLRRPDCPGGRMVYLAALPEQTVLEAGSIFSQVVKHSAEAAPIARVKAFRKALSQLRRALQMLQNRLHPASILADMSKPFAHRNSPILFDFILCDRMIKRSIASVSDTSIFVFNIIQKLVKINKNILLEAMVVNVLLQFLGFRFLS